MNHVSLAKVTAQGTATKLFYDLEVKTLVTQCSGRGKAREAQVNFGVGFLSSPVESDNLLVTEIRSALYAIGGTTAKIQETVALKPGERFIYSTDAAGNVKGWGRFNNDGSVEVENENGNYKMQADGEFNVNDDNLKVLPNP